MTLLHVHRVQAVMAALVSSRRQPMAFSLPGRHGLVVTTAGLAKQLTPDEVLAVLDHERAHVRGHHHLVLAVSEVTAWAAPFLRLLREAPAALVDLVELAADAAAAPRCRPEGGKQDDSGQPGGRSVGSRTPGARRRAPFAGVTLVACP